MSVELITGKAGEPHVDSEDIGVFNAYVIGAGNYTMNGCAMSVTNANTIHIAPGELLVEGRHVRIKGDGEDVAIANGTTGYKRIDLICLKYQKFPDNGDIESVSFEVITGTPTTGTPEEPSVDAGSILSGDTIVYEKFGLVTIDGLAPQTPSKYFGSARNTRQLDIDVTALKGKFPVSVANGGTGATNTLQAAQNMQMHSLGISKNIPDGSDLNNYKTPGNYTCTSGVNAKTIKNKPELMYDCAFSLKVDWNILNENSSTNYMYTQTLRPRGGSDIPIEYRRMLLSEGWSNWGCTGGVDAIVAQGTSGVWYYQKFSSGWAICRATISKNVTSSADWGALHDYSPSFAQPYPFSFVSEPMELGSISAVNNVIMTSIASNTDAYKLKQSKEYTAVRTASKLESGRELRCSILAFGRWK